MRRALPLLSLLLATTAVAQSQTPTLSAFDVASVRQNKSGGPQHSNVPLDSGNVYTTLSPEDSGTAAGGFFVATHQPLWRYITFAYHLSGTQELALRFSYFSGLPKSGAPTWVTGTFHLARRLLRHRSPRYPRHLHSPDAPHDASPPRRAVPPRHP